MRRLYRGRSRGAQHCVWQACGRAAAGPTTVGLLLTAVAQELEAYEGQRGALGSATIEHNMSAGRLLAVNAAAAAV
jgi:hypothetical protein